MIHDQWIKFLTRWNDGQVSSDELTEWQTAALQTVLDRVSDKSPFYRERMSRQRVIVRGVHAPRTSRSRSARARG